MKKYEGETDWKIGELKEMDKPEALLSNPDSIFSNLVSSALEATSQNKNRLEMS